MWESCELSFVSYLPDELEVGMLFINKISVGVIEPYIELFELKELPENQDEFLSKNGAPIEIIIISDNILVEQDQIGWLDEGEGTDEYRDITLEDINLIIQEWNGYLLIEIDENNEPIILEDKVILTFDQEDMFDEE